MDGVPINRHSQEMSKEHIRVLSMTFWMTTPTQWNQTWTNACCPKTFLRHCTSKVSKKIFLWGKISLTKNNIWLVAAALLAAWHGVDKSQSQTYTLLAPKKRSHKARLTPFGPEAVKCKAMLKFCIECKQVHVWQNWVRWVNFFF